MSSNTRQDSIRMEDNIETIKKIYALIRSYQEVLVNRGNFVDRTPKEIEKTKAIFQAIENLLAELSNLDKYEEKANKLANICKDIIRRYNKIREEEFLDELEEVDDFINSYGSQPTFPYAKYGEREEQWPTDEEVQKMPIKDLS